MEETSCSCCATEDNRTPRRLPAWATRNRLLMAGGGVLVAGLALNWGWLTAVGVAPILVAILPCAVMCTLGLCLMGMRKTPQHKEAVSVLPPPESPAGPSS